MNSNREHLIRLKDIIYNSLDPLIGKDYCLLDIPGHSNMGDQLIFRGELEYLKRLPCKMTYVSNDTFYDLNKIQPDNIILLHGGGNFGDVWRGHQDFRLKVIKNFTANKIIILPQTVFYRKIDRAVKDAQIFNEHPDLTICARDMNSYDFLKKYFVNNKILLVPDMAFCLNLDQYITQTKTNKVLIFKRTDKETNKHLNLDNIKAFIPGNRKIEIKDWPSMEIKDVKFRVVSIINFLNLKISKAFMNSSVLRRLLDHKYGLLRKDLSAWYSMEGIKFINKYDEIYTTRLHGYIFSILLNKKVHMLDNSYGKNSSFFNTWMTDFKNSEFLKY